MESKRRPKIQQHIIGRFKKKSSATILCKKHPKHKQSPGVCAMCLREKLTQLSSTSNNNKNKKRVVSTYSSSSLSSLSSETSSIVSSLSSPVHHRSYFTGGAKGSFSVAFLRSGKNVFMKSRSIACIEEHGKVKKGFWWRILQPRKEGNAFR